MKQHSFEVKAIDGPDDHRMRDVLPKAALDSGGKPRPRNRVPWRPFLAILIISGTGFAIWRTFTLPVDVVLAPAVYADLSQSFTAEAVVKGKDYEVAAEVMGRVTRLHVREGNTVQAGQALVELEPDDSEQNLRQAISVREAASANYKMSLADVRSVEAQLNAGISTAESRVRQAATILRRSKIGPRQEEVDLARHMAEKAQAVLDERAKAYTRAKNLVEAGALSRAMFDSAEAEYRAALAAVAEAKSSLDLILSGPRPEDIEIARSGYELALSELAAARSRHREVEVRKSAVDIARARLQEANASLQLVKIQVGRRILRAPASGTLVKVNIEAGGVVVIGLPLIRISTSEDLRIDTEISTEDISKIRPGMHVRVTSAAYPGRSFPGRIVEIMPVGELKPDAAIRTRIIRARVMLASHLDFLRPGMELDVEGEALKRRVLVIPSDALIISGERETVYLVKNGIVIERTVNTGQFDAQQTEVLGGLKEGERVIVQGKDRVTVGSRVTERT